MTRRRAAAFAAAIATTFAACSGGGTSGQGASEEILVGEFSSLTGGTATFGQSTHNGITLAFDEINAAGGVLGKKLKVLVEDDQSKPEEAATAVTEAHQPGPGGGGPGRGRVARARWRRRPSPRRTRCPMISPSSTNPKVTEVGDYIFRVCFIDPFQGAVMAKFAANTLKLKKVAILNDVRNDYSVGLRELLQRDLQGPGRRDRRRAGRTARATRTSARSSRSSRA